MFPENPVNPGNLGILSKKKRRELQRIEEGFELRGDLGPGVDGDVAGGAVGDATAEVRVVRETVS